MGTRGQSRSFGTRQEHRTRAIAMSVEVIHSPRATHVRYRIGR
jgi:hypothetical protein